MKKWFSILLAAALVLGVCPMAAQAVQGGGGAYCNPREKEPAVFPLSETDGIASSGECGDDVTWNLTEEGVLTISGNGPMWDYPVDYPGWFEYAEWITECIIEEGVTYIGEYAFYACESMTAVEIPEGVTAIGYGAFYSCTNLAFVKIPEGVTFVDSWAFYGCENLNGVVIPASLESVAFCMFYGCDSLVNVYYGGTEDQWWEMDIEEGNEILSMAVMRFESTGPAPQVVRGDCNGDGKVNGLDLILLRQYLADWEVELNQTAADTNADSKVNGLDLILLRQYLADWDVTLGT